ncbi:MAG: glycosyltransferase [Spirochaetes bacterium]|nr:glycosyltransferase [Spirochaetota bacterium]
MSSLLSAFRLVLAGEKGATVRLMLLAPRAQVPTLERIRRRRGFSDAQVIVRPSVPRDELVRLLQTAVVSVSNLPNDGVPVSMLEAMACGALPVMSNLESIREWITHGVNGLLFDPDNPEE